MSTTNHLSHQGVKRSPKWPTVRRAHLKREPVCQLCGCTIKARLNVHHVVPFHLAPDMELLEDNLITWGTGKR